MPLQFEPLNAPVRRRWALVCRPWLVVLALGLAACSSPLPRPSGEEGLAPAPLTAVPVAPSSRPAAQARAPKPAAVSVNVDPDGSVAVEQPDAAAAAETVAARSPATDAGTVFAKGRASWYGKRFHGRRTASGERFDMHALTAAHKTLPFGTRVRVRSVRTGKEVVVRINDRGPYTHQRIIDLSHAAATALGVRERGVTEVHLLRE